MAEEIELKLEVEPCNLALLLEDPLFGHAKRHTANQVTIYYDTPETKLRNHGLTLRVRECDGRFVQTVKSASRTVGLVSREEIEFDVSGMAPDLDPLREHPLNELVGDRPNELQPILRCDVLRTSAEVHHGGARFRLDLDHGSLNAAQRTEDFAELEFELVEGPPASLLMAARRLSERVPVRLGVLTKAERGARLAAGKSRKVVKSQAIDINSGMTVAEAFAMIVSACIKHYRLNEPLVIRDLKVEALHQARVAMRRLRSALTLFKPAIEDVEFEHLREELRWFTGELGDARNIDVYLERELPDEERSNLMRERERAYDRVADAMNSHRFSRLLIDLVAWLSVGSWRKGKAARRSIGGLANRRLDRLWDEIAELGENIDRLEEEVRHQLRIKVKKLRYGMEFFQGLYSNGVEQKHFASQLETLQEELGKLNDLATAKGIRAEPRSDGWLIGSYEERRHLKAAKEAFRNLLKAGPFWRSNAPSDVVVRLEDAVPNP